ncbi:MAG: gamma-glutamyltransferase [Chloroflexi bacterium]|nr:gamma-glutamyltransferase [Chloroflexota bacterium]
MRFASRRSNVLARHGMVATSEPLAAVAGLRTLLEGGNAVDAAVATAAALCVTEPMSTGLGGDMFALVWLAKEKRVLALNGSGRAPAAASLEEIRRQGHASIPDLSPYAVTVPGAVHGWETLLKACGTMPLSRVLEPAIRYAEDGYPVAEVIAERWQRAEEKLLRYPSGGELLRDGRAPREGEVVRLPALARTLRAVAEGGSDAFYHGPVAEAIAGYLQQQGGWLSAQDMASHASTWDQPITTDYRGATVWECPPNGQGLAALLALNIAEGFDLAGMGPQTPESYHHLIEAMRLALADALHYIADPALASVPVAGLLSKEYAAGRRALVHPDRAMPKAAAGSPIPAGDTVYLAAVDGGGNACSFINSLFQGFGTGLVAPGTGVVLHNRGSIFSLDPAHPNALAPRKRPYHTIIPAMATRKGELWLTFGVMGAFQQPQGHLQVLTNMLDYGMGPQEALDALRFSVQRGAEVALEDGVSEEVVAGLQQRGHQINIISGYDRMQFGGGQVIERDTAGVLRGGSDPRKDGCAVGW